MLAVAEVHVAMHLAHLGADFLVQAGHLKGLLPLPVVVMVVLLLHRLREITLCCERQQAIADAGESGRAFLKARLLAMRQPAPRDQGGRCTRCAVYWRRHQCERPLPAPGRGPTPHAPIPCVVASASQRSSETPPTNGPYPYPGPLASAAIRPYFRIASMMTRACPV